MRGNEKILPPILHGVGTLVPLIKLNNKSKRSRYVESNDSFESWSIVTESYRVVGTNESSKYIERVESSGSITIIKR